MNDRRQPWSEDAERSILGAALVDPRVLDVVVDRLKPEMFYRPEHGTIFRAMLDLHAKNKPVEFLSVKELLLRRQALETVGGPAYLTSLTDGTPRGVNVGYYAHIVREKASARAVIDLANQLLEKAYSSDGEAAALIDDAERGLLAISEQAVPGDLASAPDMVQRLLPVLDSVLSARRSVTGISTGFLDLDRYTRGLQPGNLVILGGRPSQGKSTIAAQIALHVAQTFPVAFFSVEMSEQEQAFRILATLAQVDGHQLQCGQLSMYDQQRVAPALEDFHGRQLWLDESGTLSPLQIRSRARRLKARVGLGLVVVDYLQLLQHGKADSREQQVATTGRMLKQIARELSVPVLALCQLSRSVEQRQGQQPKLSDLRESGSLEQDADLVLLIHRPPKRDDGGISSQPPTELIIAKSRNGPTTSIDLRWISEQYRYEQIAA